MKISKGLYKILLFLLPIIYALFIYIEIYIHIESRHTFQLTTFKTIVLPMVFIGIVYFLYFLIMKNSHRYKDVKWIPKVYFGLFLIALLVFGVNMFTVIFRNLFHFTITYFNEISRFLIFNIIFYGFLSFKNNLE